MTHPQNQVRTQDKPFDGSNIQKKKATKSYGNDPEVLAKKESLLKTIQEIRDKETA